MNCINLIDINTRYSSQKISQMHDRLGSVRQVINQSGSVMNYYTYNPFGETLESGGSFANPFMFTGQYYDSEIGEYYLRARQYDPHIGRFTSRDPVLGRFQESLTLHRYLYCTNDPINKLDLKGEFPWLVTGALTLGTAFFALHYFWDVFDIQELKFWRIRDKDIQTSINNFSFAYNEILKLKDEDHGIRTKEQLAQTLESRGVYGVGLYGYGVVGRGHELPYGQRKIIAHFESFEWMGDHPDIFSLFPKPHEYDTDPEGCIERQIYAESERMDAVIEELQAEAIRRLINFD